MRLAWFTPFAPVRSGISAYSAELLPLLAGSHEVDVFVEDAVWTHWAERVAGKPPILTRSGAVALEGGLDGRLRLWRAHDFMPRQLARAYDLVVYQLGNATCHEFMWPYLMRYPGLVVLHDGQLHHARAHALLRYGRKLDYIAEFRDAHPDAPEDLAQFVIGGLQGPVYYMWPLVSAVVRAARAVAVHNPRLADELREGFPEAAVDVIRMGVADVPAALPAATRPAGPLRFAAFGLVTQEKRIPQALRALAAVSKVAPTPG